VAWARIKGYRLSEASLNQSFFLTSYSLGSYDRTDCPDYDWSIARFMRYHLWGGPGKSAFENLIRRVC
jgi:hypothetical protein